MTAGPGARVGFSDRLYVFHQGFKDDGQLWYSYFDGQTWAGDQQVANVGMSESPSATVFNDRLYVFHQGSGDDGQLWYSLLRRPDLGRGPASSERRHE